MIAICGLAVGFLASCSSTPAKSPVPSSSSVPSASVLATPMAPEIGIQLSPPPPGTTPGVTAAQAWHAMEKLPAVAKYRLVLADWKSTSALQFGSTLFPGGLVWVIEGRHVPSQCSGGAAETGMSSRPCGSLYESAMWIVNASTGQASTEEFMYPPGT